ncbi:helix-turn-helix transcriptional regulator [Streptomyces sp. NPDC088253]|uniref:helix-turn-helix transcriptional regulator n=1 Tax=Streptomyces sp. NPDC088253 TaxID=3365846 RepID=UPI00380B864D
MNSAQGRPLKPLSADADPYVAAVAEALRDLRLRSGLPLRQLAARCNYSPATLSMAASGKSLPRFEVVEAYVRGCLAQTDADLDGELAHFKALWRQAEEGRKTQRENVPADAEPGSVRRPSTERRNARHTRRSSPMAFADAVVRPDGGHQVRGPKAHSPSSPSVPSPRRKDGSLHAAMPLPDPGESVEGLVRQARLMSSDPSQTALNLCSTPEHFIELLSRMRESNGLSFRDLSNRCRSNGYPVSKSTLHDLLNGKELPSTELLHAFLHSCGCDPGNWMAWHQTRTRLKIAQLLSRTEEHYVIGLIRRDRFSRTAIIGTFVFMTLLAQVVVALLTLN